MKNSGRDPAVGEGLQIYNRQPILKASIPCKKGLIKSKEILHMMIWENMV